MDIIPILTSFSQFWLIFEHFWPNFEDTVPYFSIFFAYYVKFDVLGVFKDEIDSLQVFISSKNYMQQQISIYILVFWRPFCFCSVEKIAGIFQRGLGAKFLLYGPKK